MHLRAFPSGEEGEESCAQRVCARMGPPRRAKASPWSACDAATTRGLWVAVVLLASHVVTLLWSSETSLDWKLGVVRQIGADVVAGNMGLGTFGFGMGSRRVQRANPNVVPMRPGRQFDFLDKDDYLASCCPPSFNGDALCLCHDDEGFASAAGASADDETSAMRLVREVLVEINETKAETARVANQVAPLTNATTAWFLARSDNVTLIMDDMATHASATDAKDGDAAAAFREFDAHLVAWCARSRGNLLGEVRFYRTYLLRKEFFKAALCDPDEYDAAEGKGCLSARNAPGPLAGVEGPPRGAGASPCPHFHKSQVALRHETLEQAAVLPPAARANDAANDADGDDDGEEQGVSFARRAVQSRRGGRDDAASHARTALEHETVLSLLGRLDAIRHDPIEDADALVRACPSERRLQYLKIFVRLLLDENPEVKRALKEGEMQRKQETRRERRERKKERRDRTEPTPAADAKGDAGGGGGSDGGSAGGVGGPLLSPPNPAANPRPERRERQRDRQRDRQRERERERHAVASGAKSSREEKSPPSPPAAAALAGSGAEGHDEAAHALGSAWEAIAGGGAMAPDGSREDTSPPGASPAVHPAVDTGRGARARPPAKGVAPSPSPSPSPPPPAERDPKAKALNDLRRKAKRQQRQRERERSEAAFGAGAKRIDMSSLMLGESQRQEPTPPRRRERERRERERDRPSRNRESPQPPASASPGDDGTPSDLASGFEAFLRSTDPMETLGMEPEEGDEAPPEMSSKSREKFFKEAREKKPKERRRREGTVVGGGLSKISRLSKDEFSHLMVRSEMVSMNTIAGMNSRRQKQKPNARKPRGAGLRITNN